ncbi:MAG: ABC transporter ATP-binding protein, partial [Acidimicrobiia bacterium]|nr:ABC transporter ATP-binding protein [Acidimicrobiia bacterium]
VRYGGLVALDHVTVAVEEGSITGLIGPNGAGKTTCFGVLSGLVRPRDGRVLLDGADVTRASPQRRARAGMARTFQHQELFTSLTVREHLVLARRSRDRNVAGRVLLDCIGFGGRARSGEDDAVDGLLELVGLTHVAGARAGTVPPGIGRLVELGRALATEPRVLLLDEPSSGLDADETGALTECLRTVRAARGVSMLLVEHNVAMVLGLADRMTVLDFGRVIAEGPPDEVANSDVVQAAYLGTAP